METKTGGGSTITQQLGKQLFPRENYSRQPIKFAIRKFREWVIAVKLEKSFAKEEIVALYLNKFDFLNNGDGILTASRVYFNASPIDLKVEEAAMSAAMAKNPSAYNPKRFEERAFGRRNLVLGKMKELEKRAKCIQGEVCTAETALFRITDGGEIEMDEFCTVYSERSDYKENEIWRYHIVGKEERRGRPDDPK